MATYRVTYLLGDDQTPQGQVTKTFEYEAADDAAAATAFTAFDTDFRAVTAMAVLQIVGPALVNNVGASPTAGADATKGLSASVYVNAAGKRANMTVPAPVTAIMSGNSLVDNAALWLAYLENFTLGGGGFTVSDGENVRGFTASDVAGGKRVVIRASRRLPV